MLPLNGMAEYRAYQYIVTTKSENQTDLTKSKTTVINSSLAPTAYCPSWRRNLIKVELINSWQCQKHRQQTNM